jgi:two-component system cell cycle sensor histidine kinase/response regulator CckA
MHPTLERRQTLSFLLSPEGVILDANQAARSTVGLALEDLVGRALCALFASEHRARWKSALHEVAQTGSSLTFEATVLIPQGSRTVMFAATAARSLYKGASSNIFVNGIDVTERNDVIDARRALRQQLQQLQRMELVSRVTNSAAHDFNNILRSVESMVELASGAADDPDVVRASLRDVSTEIARALAIARQLFVCGRTDLGERRPTNINEVITDTARVMRPLLSPRITIGVHLHHEPIRVMANASQLEQLLMSLCLNARDAMTDGGTLRLTSNLSTGWHPRLPERHVTPADAYAVMEVSDTGWGIPVELQPHIFEPYFTTKELTDGTGLGLAIVQMITRGHGGAIEFDTTLGVGSTFRVYLPVGI